MMPSNFSPPTHSLAAYVRMPLSPKLPFGDVLKGAGIRSPEANCLNKKLFSGSVSGVLWAGEGIARTQGQGVHDH